MNIKFGRLFKKLRLQSGIATLAELGKLLSEKGYIYEDSLLSHWQNGRKIPVKRNILLALLKIFNEKKSVSVSDANKFLQLAGQGYLTNDELNNFQKDNTYNKNKISLNSKVKDVSDELKIKNQSKQLISKIRKIIADRGLDDKEWSKAFSSQYFTILTARLLGLTDSSDYKNLLNNFVSNFYLNVDNSIVFHQEKSYLINVRASRLRKCMFNEDRSDKYFSKYYKSSYPNIDWIKLRDNFINGLISQISFCKEFTDCVSLKSINEYALQNLICCNSKRSTDDHGGWYPRRTPWVTARVLIALKKSGYEKTKHKNEIDRLIQKALNFLVDAIYEKKYWKSGTGEWCTDLETTALCLEALDTWDKIEEYRDEIYSVIKYVHPIKNDLVKGERLMSEEDSTRALTAVVLITNTSILIDKHFKQDFELNYFQSLKYFSKILNRISKDNNIPVRQYCTIPEIIYYIAKFLVKGLSH